MKKILLSISVAATLFMTSCTVNSRMMREPNTRLNLVKSDFTISEQFSAEAEQTKILGIDFARLFKREYGSVARDGGAGGATSLLVSIPVIGGFANPAPKAVENFAMFNIMQDHKGYDVVFYPQFETNSFSFLGLYTKTKVKVTARLAKLKQ
jgi:hypothetical protein